MNDARTEMQYHKDIIRNLETLNQTLQDTVRLQKTRIVALEEALARVTDNAPPQLEAAAAVAPPISSANVNGSHPKLVPDVETRKVEPKPSPDGRRLATVLGSATNPFVLDLHDMPSDCAPADPSGSGSRSVQGSVTESGAKPRPRCEPCPQNALDAGHMSEQKCAPRATDTPKRKRDIIDPAGITQNRKRIRPSVREQSPFYQRSPSYRPTPPPADDNTGPVARIDGSESGVTTHTLGGDQPSQSRDLRNANNTEAGVGWLVIDEEDDLKPIEWKLEVQPLRIDLDASVKLPEIQVDVKMEIGHALLNADIIQARLLAMSVQSYPVTVRPTLRDITVNRKFMSQVYGGSPQSMCPSINMKNRTHRFRNFLFPTLMLNPHAPKEPGEPGLLLRVTKDAAWQPGDQKLLVGLRQGTYRYMGEYTMVRAEPLSREEYKSLPANAKREWAGEILRRRKDKGLRVRIILRRENPGREPTEQEVKEAIGDTNNEYRNVNEAEIIRAFKTGQETMSVWCMKSVGYDEGFQRDVARYR
ncbi:uncharacterized protein FIBRA_00681 [Fibroporia radiculosa]|uniref:DUF6697 domain-containing protein n=1 Tax=Fibroporia radiculosa TaxID=599839 RepID=J4H0G9_9APHY|nr:uncharacterized protein FIBRA_00681 [Fibroporia radiculosa]CCL98679.1 predicted protein [Fibroporia radiculosa]